MVVVRLFDAQLVVIDAEYGLKLIDVARLWDMLIVETDVND